MRVILVIIWMYIPKTIGVEKSILFSIIRFMFVVGGTFAIMYSFRKKNSGPLVQVNEDI